jgi:hypothetical protein
MINLLRYILVTWLLFWFLVMKSILDLIEGKGNTGALWP